MTVREWLVELAAINVSTEQDSARMEAVLHKCGFPSAKVVYGIVYLDGYGRPESIHSMAQALLTTDAKAETIANSQ